MQVNLTSVAFDPVAFSSLKSKAFSFPLSRFPFPSHPSTCLWSRLSRLSSSGPRLQVEPGEEADPGSPRGAGDDGVSPSGCSEAQSVLEPRDGAAHQRQQVTDLTGV